MIFCFSTEIERNNIEISQSIVVRPGERVHEKDSVARTPLRIDGGPLGIQRDV